MKDFKHTHKMHHGHHAVFGGGARPAMQSAGMSPMMPPGGMGGIQSAGQDMASAAPGGMGAGGAGAAGGTGGAGYKRGGKIMMKAEGGGVTENQRVGRAMSQKNKTRDIAYANMKGLMPEIPNPDFYDELDNAASEDLRTAKSRAGYKEGGMAKGGNWIKDATKNKGALHRSLGVPMGEKIPMSKIKKAEKSSDPKLAKRARLAETLKGFKK
jgi:hypothetical protein